MKTGTLSIHTENIFPIIKKFLYSNQEVFLRELVSNAQDASQKLQTLASLGEVKGEIGELKIQITIDKQNKKLHIKDYGIGMTAEEVEKYINQIAFSGAEEFLKKYKDAQIIGHFGLGFYSAFMVAQKVEIFTKSYKEEEPAVHWSCEGETSFTLENCDKSDRGTEIVLHIQKDCEEFLESYRINEILNKYCKFLPIPIIFENKTINETAPLWIKKPSELQNEDYEQFYRKLYPMSELPMFWIHLNVDYPFHLTGILYFPKIKPNMDLQRNKIQLYSNQVFITDNVEDIVPDFLTLLHGVIDSPDIPLNVSRSYLQTDANVKKITQHITKKVADKLNAIFKENREDYQSKWENIGVFVKYGMIRDNNFYEKVKDICLLQTVDNELYTIEEFKEKTKILQVNKNNELIWLYSNDLEAQELYIRKAKNHQYQVLRMDGIVDMHFISFMEHQLDKTQFVRVDSDTIEKIIDKGIEASTLLSEEDQNTLKEIFKSAAKNDLIAFQFQNLSSSEMPVIVIRPEYQRRMQDMTHAQFAGIGNIPDLFTVIINSNHHAVKKIFLLPNREEQVALAKQMLDLAYLAQGMLKGEDLYHFIENQISKL